MGPGEFVANLLPMICACRQLQDHGKHGLLGAITQNPDKDNAKSDCGPHCNTANECQQAINPSHAGEDAKSPISKRQIFVDIGELSHAEWAQDYAT